MRTSAASVLPDEAVPELFAHETQVSAAADASSARMMDLDFIGLENCVVDKCSDLLLYLYR